MKKNIDKILAVIIVIISCVVAFIFQTQKVGFHEDEVYTLSSSVSPINGLLSTYDTGVKWYTKEYVQDYYTLKKENIFNFKALYNNQKSDNHPPFFYTLVHFSYLIFGGKFNKYTVFLVNIIAFIISCFIIYKILNLIKKPNLILGTLLLYGLSMGTISLIIFQRMYMVLTMFILAYYYLSLKIYNNKYDIKTKDLVLLGIVTVTGFLTQYFFAIFVVWVFLILLIDMIKNFVKKKLKLLPIIKYVVSHMFFAGFAILSFRPAIDHLLYSPRGISNLSNGGFIDSLWIYIKHLAYAFSINEHIILFVLGLFTGLIIYYLIKSKNKLVMLTLVVPTVLFFLISVHMTSFKEMRYILPLMPFICIIVMMVFESINKKFNNKFVYLGLSIIFVGIGFIFSKPKFLYKNYQEKLDIANSHSDLPYVYITDNLFCHVQSVPEMMIYRKSVFINVNHDDEFEYLFNGANLEENNKFVLSIKDYMDNEAIINEIMTRTEFKKVSTLYKYDKSLDDSVCDNVYLLSK